MSANDGSPPPQSSPSLLRTECDAGHPSSQVTGYPASKMKYAVSPKGVHHIEE